MRRLRWNLLWCFLLAAVVFAAQDKLAAGDDKPAVVELIVDFGDGVKKQLPQIPWTERMTVLDVMNLASKQPAGMRFEFRGKGATAFLTQIDNTKNEGRGRNWIYRVNGELADRSFAIYKLQAGDTVLWKFGDDK